MVSRKLLEVTKIGGEIQIVPIALKTGDRVIFRISAPARIPIYAPENKRTEPHPIKGDPERIGNVIRDLRVNGSIHIGEVCVTLIERKNDIRIGIRAPKDYYVTYPGNVQ